MSISFVITPYESATWKTAQNALQIDPARFQQAVYEKWPQATFEQGSNGDIHWHVAEHVSVFRGILLSDRQVITFEPGDWHLMFEFVVWYRRFVPEEHSLFFFNSSASRHLQLTPGVTREEVERFSNDKG